MLVKKHHAGPYVILLDSFNGGPQFALYRWQLNSQPGNRIEIDAEAERAAIHGPQHRLEIAWAYPGPGEYDLPHQMKLSTDEIDSHVWEVESAGIGVRPRLKANLYGHNGQLLTALVPRRGDQPDLEIERSVAPNQLGLVLQFGEVTDTVVASPFLRLLDLNGIWGEARLAVVRRDGHGRTLWWAAADVNALEVDGEVVVPRQDEPAALREIVAGKQIV